MTTLKTVARETIPDTMGSVYEVTMKILLQPFEINHSKQSFSASVTKEGK